MDFGADWRWGDTLGAVAALGAIHADVETTKSSLSKGGHETNPIYGTPHPSGSALDQGELAADAITLTVAAATPSKYRKMALGAIAGFEAGMAERNSRLPATGKPNAFGEDLAKPLMGMLLGVGVGALASKQDMTVLPTKGGITLGLRWRF